MEHINPTREQLEEVLAEIPLDHPVVMLNLLRFKEQAAYSAEDERQHSPCSGRDAYARYSAVAGQKLTELGANIIWSGKPVGTLIGPVDELWDEAFLVRYPTANAFFRMLSMPDYTAATVHRTAALADSRLIPIGEGELPPSGITEL